MAKNLRKTAQPVKGQESPQKKTLFEKLFGMSIEAVSWGKEILAGLSGLVGTAFILFAWSSLFHDQFAGQVEHFIIIGTLVAMILSNLAQSFWAKLPYVITPSIGTLMVMLPILSIGSSFNIIMAILIIEGVIFLALSFLPFAKKVVSSIPSSIKNGIVLSVGVMLIFMGLGLTGLFGDPIVSGASLTVDKIKMSSATSGIPTISLRWLLDSRTFVMVLGLAIVGYFSWTKNKYTILITIILMAAIGAIFASAHMSTAAGADFALATPYKLLNINDIFLNFGAWTGGYLAKPGFLELFNKISTSGTDFALVVSAIILLLAKDTVSTSASLVALGRQSGDMTENDTNHHRSEKALQVVGFNRIVSGIVGGVPADIAPESVIAVEAEGKTSVTPFIYAIGCAVLLVVFKFFVLIPAIAVAPVLVMIGAGMLRNVGKIHWKDALEAIPIVVMMVVAALTYNIFYAVVLGFSIHMILRIAVWKFEDTNGGYWLMGLLSLASTIFFFAMFLR